MPDVPKAPSEGASALRVGTIIGALADDDRRRVLAAIELGATRLDEVTTATALPEHRCAKALGWLVSSHIVVTDPGGGLHVDAAALRTAAKVALSRPPSDEHAGEPPDRRKVLDAFVREGRITSMPTAPSKRRIVLDWLAATFDVGRRYTEAEVNAVLDGHAEDHATLRRALVDADLLDRDETAYWRCGGTIT